MNRIVLSIGAYLGERGNGSLAFTMYFDSRMILDLAPRGLRARPWTPFRALGAGTFSVSPQGHGVRLTAEGRISNFVLVRLVPVAVALTLIMPWHSWFARFTWSAVVGLAVGASCYALARWDLREWVTGLAQGIGAGVASGRLTSG